MNGRAPTGFDKTSIIVDKGLQIAVRPSVAARRRVVGGHPLYYLSLFDDEIDARLEDFLSVARMHSGAALSRNPFALEPTDAVVAVVHDGTIYVWRGGAANFPLYWTRDNGSVLLSTALPIDSTRRLSVSGLLASIAVASVPGQNEPNLSTRTPLAGWFRCRRGAVTGLFPGNDYVSQSAVDLACGHTGLLDRGELIEALRSAISAFGRRQVGVRSRALIEVSGGFDSTIAAIGPRRCGMNLVGVSESFPYYEFRYEEEIQQAVADSLGLSRIRLDGAAHFAYAPSDWLPKLDEPAMGVLRLKRALASARVACSEGVNRIFVGHGGDQLFAEDLLDRETIHALDPRAFSDFARREVESFAQKGCCDPLMRKSTLTFSHDARFDVPFKEAFGVTTRSPYTDVALIRCGLLWARLPARTGASATKQILADAFPKELPNAVTHRRGKVPWNGVTARAYAAHADDIIAELDRVRSPLERIGLNIRWLDRRVGQLADGSKSTWDRCDKELIAGYAMATWLHSWGILRVTDCEWAE